MPRARTRLLIGADMPQTLAGVIQGTRWLCWKQATSYWAATPFGLLLFSDGVLALPAYFKFAVPLKADPGEEAVLPGKAGGVVAWHDWLGRPVGLAVLCGSAADASPVEKISRQAVPVRSPIF
jgi:hypothetical protein